MLMFSRPSYAVMHLHCSNAQVCSGTGSERTCNSSQLCWTIWEPDFNPPFFTEPIYEWPGVGVPNPPRDANADAVMDCWKNITDNGSRSSGFPFRNNGTEQHNGVDITSGSTNYGHAAPIRSLGAGYVTAVGNDPSSPNGNFVRVAQGDGNEITYIHLLDHQVQVHQELKVGQLLGRMNCTGYCGPTATRGNVQHTHVHVQAKRANGSLVDAEDFYGGESCLATPPSPPPGGGQQCQIHCP